MWEISVTITPATIAQTGFWLALFLGLSIGRDVTEREPWPERVKWTTAITLAFVVPYLLVVLAIVGLLEVVA